MFLKYVVQIIEFADDTIIPERASVEASGVGHGRARDHHS